MIVLDTNVVSEAFRPQASQTVADWFAAQPAEELFVCAPVMAELHYGVMRLAQSRKRQALAQRYSVIRREFRSKVLAFNLVAAEAFADIFATRERAGRPILLIDAQIAAIARSRSAAVATRDVRDFDGCGVTVIDPWAHAG